jgi:hypothetical protein
VINVDIRREVKGLGEVFEMLSKTKEGRLHLLELTKIEENGIEMLKHEALLSVVVEPDIEPFTCTMTLAHCLVLSRHEDVQLAISKMPARILELKTSGGDKVVEFLITHGSAKVLEALAENADALKITCLELLSDSGQIDVLGIKIDAVDSTMLRQFRGHSVAHLLLAGNPSDAVVKRIAVAPKEVLALVNGEGKSVEQMLKEKIKPQRHKSR